MPERAYLPRTAEESVLHALVRDHLETFLAETAARSDGVSLPAFVVKEFRDFLGCGVLARGFARVRCGDCAFERLVPFSCKGRGYAECWNMLSPEAPARAASRCVGAAALMRHVLDFA